MDTAGSEAESILLSTRWAPEHRGLMICQADRNQTHLWGAPQGDFVFYMVCNPGVQVSPHRAGALEPVLPVALLCGRPHYQAVLRRPCC